MSDFASDVLVKMADENLNPSSEINVLSDVGPTTDVDLTSLTYIGCCFGFSNVVIRRLTHDAGITYCQRWTSSVEYKLQQGIYNRDPWLHVIVLRSSLSYNVYCCHICICQDTPTRRLTRKVSNRKWTFQKEVYLCLLKLILSQNWHSNGLFDLPNWL